MRSRDLPKEENIIKEDWTFLKAKTKYMTHGLHPYPARMIPQIARKLIIRYSKPGDIVLDPFMGSGGVLVEATLKLPSELSWQIGARKSYGIDINPLAILLANAKTNPIEPKFLHMETSNFLSQIKDEIEAYRSGRIPITPPHFHNIDYWFKSEAKNELQIIRKNLETIKNSGIKTWFEACFSRTVRECSNTRRNEFKLYRIPDEALASYDPKVFEAFRDNVQKAEKCMEEYYEACELREWARPKILDEDTRKRTSIPKGTVDLVVTSPPYGDSRTTVAYGQFSRLSMQWLDIDGRKSRTVDQRSLGGYRSKTLYHKISSSIFSSTLRKIERKDRERAKDVLSFFSDLKKCMHEISQLMADDGKVCIVIGNRTVKGLRLPTDRIIINLGKTEGFELSHTYNRRIPTKRMPWENAPSNIKGERGRTINEEYILVLDKV